MKALSLRQPYSELLASGRKTIELRPWNTSFRGEFLIHAAKRVFWDDCKKHNVSKPKTGQIIGQATVIAVKKYNTLEEFRADRSKHLAEDRWFKSPCYGFIVTNAQPLDGPKCRGMLNFFTPKLNKTIL
jgi:ASC-1-like (ASCH) protein|tara:strand:+ start:85 stop:471 length:387 start_codon:yes stop_codon:yes gene_type:complete